MGKGGEGNEYECNVFSIQNELKFYSFVLSVMVKVTSVKLRWLFKVYVW